MLIRFKHPRDFPNRWQLNRPARLERLASEIMKETDPAAYGALGKEISQVLGEREILKQNPQPASSDRRALWSRFHSEGHLRSRRCVRWLHNSQGFGGCGKSR